MIDNLASIQASIFRAYDIRGIVGKTLTEQNIFLIGKALGSYIKDQQGSKIVVARDGRVSGPMLFKSLCKGILATGCHVIDVGMVPTPLLYYATTLFDEHSGVMLTGSHNPPEYNGLKIVVNGASLAEAKIQHLYQRMLSNQFYEGNGHISEINIVDRYLTHLAQDISLTRPLKIVVDAGNGVTGQIAPTLFRMLGCEVHELFCDIDGTFPNHHPDPSQPENLRDLMTTVRAVKADIGLAFDGDGDRLGAVTSDGEIICPDRLLMLFAQSILIHHPQAKIIYDVKCTKHLQTLIRAAGGEPIMWKTGHSLIKAKVAETKALLAGEMSGHFFFRDRWFGFDDALYAGARLLEILAQQREASETLFAAIPNSVNTPELKIPVDEGEQFHLMERLIASAAFAEAHEVLTIDGLRVSFAEGWGLVRPSNTTPCLVLRFEANSLAVLEKIKLLFRDWILSVKPDLLLPF